MESWKCIDIVIEFIEKNLSESLDIEILARESHLSPFYFQKLFKRLVGKTPMEYVKLRRLAQAAEAIRENPAATLLPLALSYGFESAEVFSRNFKEAYRITPSQYRSKPVYLSHFLKPELALNHTLSDEGTFVVTDGIVLEVAAFTNPELKYFAGYLGETSLISPGIDDLFDLWERVHKVEASIPGYISGGNGIGVCLEMGLHDKQKYFAGAQVERPVADSKYYNYTLMTGDYIICKFEAEDFYTLTTGVIDKVYHYMYLWIMEKKLAVLPEAIELYFSSQPDTSYMELWIPMAINN